LPGLHVVGLSATLTDAANHLARVADLRPDVVQEFLPSHDEIQEEGIEYSLAVKGSAAAGTSLLSTSIQATMLMARSLTPRQQPPTNPASPIAPERLYGRKVFGFSDNLDGVTAGCLTCLMLSSSDAWPACDCIRRTRGRIPPSVPEATVREWVGHVDDEMIRRYTHTG